MVSQTRAGTRDGILRQRFFGRRGHRSVHRVIDLFSLGMAACSSSARFARLPVDTPVAQGVPVARDASANLGYRTKDAGARQEGPHNQQWFASEVAGPSEFFSDLGNHHWAVIYRPGLVLRNRLVPNLSCGQRY